MSSGSPRCLPDPLVPLTSPLHHLVELALDVQLGVLRFHTLELDGNFFTRSNVGTCQGWGKQGTGSPSAGPTAPSQHHLVSASERFGTPWGRLERWQRAQHCSRGKQSGLWGTEVHLTLLREQELVHVQREGNEELGTIQRTTGWCSKTAGCAGGRGGATKGSQATSGEGEPYPGEWGPPSWKGEASGVLAVEERRGQREALSQEVTKLKSELHLASVSPAIIIMRGPSWRARG